MSIAISVVIPTYNRQELTDKAVNSVICKRPELIEIVVVDDFGKQSYVYSGTCNIHGIGVRVIRAKSNQGPGAARSLGVTQSTGSIIAFLDSDDVFCDGWIDALLGQVYEAGLDHSINSFFVGESIGSSIIVRIVEQALRIIPDQYKLTFVRIALVMSNSFHTPSIAISKNACIFGDGLRYCEDFFTNAMAIFRVDEFKKLDVPACELSRRQGTDGGESSAKLRMFKGEMYVRWLLLTSRVIPLQYKILIPLGMIYQLARVLAKMLLDLLLSIYERKSSK